MYQGRFVNISESVFSMKPDEYKKLMTQIENVKRAVIERQTLHKQTMKILKEDFQVDSLKEGRRKLVRLNQVLKEQEEALDEELKDFNERFGSLLENNAD